MRRALPALVLPAAAVTALLTGVLPSADARVVLDRIWPVLLFLVAVTVLAELADDAGLFELAAGAAARLGGGRVVRLWLLVVVLATATTVLLSLDTTAVLLTPVVLALALQLDLPPLPFAMTTVWLANTGSLLLPVANLTNLLAVQRLRWSAATWATRMWLPALVAVLVTVAVLGLLHRAELRGRYPVPPYEAPSDLSLVVLAGLCCLGLGVAVGLGTAPWLGACCATVVLAVGCAWRGGPAARSAGRRVRGVAGPLSWLVRLLPWRLVLTTVSIFLVVAAADRHGLGSVLRDLAGPGTGSTALDAVRVAGVGALGSNAVNNLPAYLAIEPAVAGGGATARLVALVVGTNVGPLVTVWASLATLLWRERCRARGVEISWRRFMAEGVVVVVPVVVVTALSVAITA